MSKINNDWLHVVLTRAIKTMAQTALGMISVGAAMSEVAWKQVISVSLVAAIYSVLTSISTSNIRDGRLVIDSASKNTDGELNISVDEEEDNKLLYSFDLNDEIETLMDKDVVTFKVRK